LQSAYQKYQDLSSSAITIVSNYDSSIEPIEIVVEDIKRAFINIIDNACYAANKKKRILEKNLFQ